MEQKIAELNKDMSSICQPSEPLRESHPDKNRESSDQSNLLGQSPFEAASTVNEKQTTGDTRPTSSVGSGKVTMGKKKKEKLRISASGGR